MEVNWRTAEELERFSKVISEMAAEDAPDFSGSAVQTW